jgi:signal transduction histidine kinase
MHPRVFAALGADLVTNDVVAVIELVKNSYDAMATRVDITYGIEGNGAGFVEIADDGLGMTRDTLENIWAVVATPYRSKHPSETRGVFTRRSSGEKGLGRLSAARLGGRLEMVTKAEGEPCWLVKVNWSNLSEQDDLSACEATCESLSSGACPIEISGTRLRIYDLESEWGAEQLGDLRENLSRLIAPFNRREDFDIHLHAEGIDEMETRIEAPAFLTKPPYSIRGHVDLTGTVRAKYEFNPIVVAKLRRSQISLTWRDIKEESEGTFKEITAPGCGPFEFEIRAWDISSSDTDVLSQRFEISKASVRKAIKAHKGISVYRDDVLVLPKSEDARDWLGLDLRRISRIGTRLSTSQVVGYVAISADRNPALTDSSNRESLTQNKAVRQFQAILKAIVAQLEVERDRDKIRPDDELKLSSLIEGVSAGDLVDEVTQLAEDGLASKEVLQRVTALNQRLHLVQNAIKLRFVYYSRLATVGSIAQLLVHEIRNRTTAVGRFLRTCKKSQVSLQDPSFSSQLELAESAVGALEKLADTFAPLASRSFRRGKRSTPVRESIDRCLSLLEREIKKSHLQIKITGADQKVAAIDPGEMDTVILNLLANAAYWTGRVDGTRLIAVRVSERKTDSRVLVQIDDSGAGVSPEDADSIFLPGITKRPGGIGMGLTIAAEVVSEHNGQLALVQPGPLGGASFRFDLPILK